MADAAAVERLRDSVTDGRTENIRYRQNQLQSLHAALRSEADALCAARAQDARASSAEVAAEFSLAMDAVRHFYDALDFDAEHRKEYLPVTEGRDNATRRLGVGLVVIRPTTHTRLYSIVAPLAAAISAGNCVILELPDTLLQTDAVLRTALAGALDVNTFSVSGTMPDPAALGPAAVLVDQTGAGGPASLTTQLLSATTRRAVAVVDRTADVEAAARAVAKARFSFGGASPYAPDLVLVHEFVKQDFFEACSKYATLAFAGEPAARKAAAGGNRGDETRRAVKAAEGAGQVVSFGSDDFKLVEILDRSTPLMDSKVTGRYLPIVTCSGLVDAIFTHQFETPLLAGYFFGDAGSAKYMAHHLPCHVSCLNQIPAQLLVGPAAPLAHDAVFAHRYGAAMFSAARPQYVEAPTGAFARADALLEGAGAGPSSSSSSRRPAPLGAAAVRALAVQPLKPTGQPGNAQLGFFEAGFLTMASITLFGLLPLLGYTTWVTGRKGLELAMRWRH